MKRLPVTASPREALTYGLTLALLAPDDARAQAAAELCDRIVARCNLPESVVAIAKSEALARADFERRAMT